MIVGRVVLRLSTVLLCTSFAWADDWPTYRHDDRRSALSDESLSAEGLVLDWVYRSAFPPEPAWGGPAKWDAFHTKKDLTPMRDYDLAFYPIVVGSRLYFGSSADDAIHCLDTKTGQQQWVYTAAGPVRISPTYVDGKVYFGSDDGFAYCLDAANGSLVWRYSPTPNRRMVVNNGRLISGWPVRTGVVVRSGTAYFAASMLPWKESYLCALDASTGSPTGSGHYIRLINAEEGRTFEAAVAADESLLFAPQGRTSLLAYDQATGLRNEQVKIAGAGSFVMITPQGNVAGGGGARTAAILVAAPRRSTQILTHNDALSMVLRDDRAYLQTARSISAVDWKTNQPQWSTDVGNVFGHIVAGDLVIAGGRDEVFALDASQGKQRWRAAVEGDAHGLVVGNGAIFVSTHEGNIYCFRSTAAGQVTPTANVDLSRVTFNTSESDKEPAVATLAAGPSVRFVAHDAAEVRWSTLSPERSTLEFVEAGKVVEAGKASAPTPSRRVEEAALKKEHLVRMTGLRRFRDYQYRIWLGAEPNLAATPWNTCENFFNYELPTLPDLPSPFAESESDPIISTAAHHILATSGVTDGICLVYGTGTGRLALDLARHSKLRIVCVDDDPERVAHARSLLQQTGAYGSRISVLDVASLSELPLPDAFANLVVSETMLTTGECIGSVRELLRTLRPAGGVLMLGQPTGVSMPLDRTAFAAWLGIAHDEVVADEGEQGLWYVSTRGKLAGSADWTHQYGTPTNQAFAGETLAGAKNVSDLQLQWLGHPGPRYQPDRQVRKPSPLAANGRLYMQGLERLIAADAYNGTILWSLEVPGLRRYNMPRDASNMCADDKHLYLAVADKCWKIDGQTGRVVQVLDVLPPPDKRWDLAWGYLAHHGDMILGSASKKGAAFDAYWGGKNWYDSKGGWDTAKVCSDNLFAVDENSGSLRWSYSHGVLMHTTIAMDAGGVYFVESRNPKVRALDHRIIGEPELFQDLYVVALNPQTGNKLWEQPIAVPSATVMISLAYGQDKVVLGASGNGKFFMTALDATDGASAWSVTLPWATDNHGGHLSRPAIVGDTIYLRPKSYNLHTGEPNKERDMAWGGCGTYACSSNAIFYRSGNISMFSPSTGENTSWSRLRPDCWLSTIPACGMVLSPEGGGGCWCSVWMETSAGFLPTAVAAPHIDQTERKYVGRMDISISSPRKGLEVRYTLDGSEPTLDSPLYQEPVRITDDRVVVKCRSYRHSAPGEHLGSEVTAAEFARDYPPPRLDYAVTYFGEPQPVGIQTDDPDGEIRFTLDGSEPTLASARFQEPILLTDTTTVKAAVFYPNGRKTSAVEKTYRKTDPVQLGDRKLFPGLQYRYAEYWGDKIPEFSSLTVAKSGLVDNFDISARLRNDGFAMQIVGYLNVTTDGEYTFSLRSDDGSRLRIGETVVVDNDGVHDPNRVRTGKIMLHAGPQPILADYFELVGGEVLEVTYEGPGIPRQPIPPTALYHLKE